LNEAVDVIRRQMLIESLSLHNGNIVRAARALGTHRNTLSRQIEEHALVDLAKHLRDEHRAESRAQREIEFEGRLPVHSPAARKIVRSQQQQYASKHGRAA
jgi:transcriptional regulator with GAF, ATPase, and Fis domain